MQSWTIAGLELSADQKLVYLACPYSHPEASVRESRFQAANRAAAELMRSGLFVFSPISHTHPIAIAGDLPLGWDFWEGYDRAILAACGRMIVLMLDGWRESKGVQAEIGIAQEMGLPVVYQPGLGVPQGESEGRAG
jgi:Domain of unknown function (DUF1937)